MTGDPLHAARRTLHTGAGLLTDKQIARPRPLFAADVHVEVEVEVEVETTWGVYQRMIATCREPDRRRGREQMVRFIDSISHAVPEALTEVITLGRMLARRAADVLACFDRPETSKAPTKTIIGRLEHLCESAL